MSQKSKQQLRQTNNANFPNNNSAFITPEKLREFNNDIIDSVALDENTELSGSVVISGSLSVTGTISGDISASTNWNTITDKPSGLVSGSSQIDLSSATGTAANATSASYAITASHALNAGASDWNDIENKPSGLVSGSSQVSDLTGSLLTTASFDNGTRDMTFTKGDGSTFTTNIPDATVATGSLLTTASSDFSIQTFTKGDGSTFEVDVTPREVIESVINKNGFMAKGTPVYVSGSTGNALHVYAASASRADRMPATFVLKQDLNTDEEGYGILTGFINGVNTSTFAAGDSVYVGANGGYTNTKPTGSGILIQKLGNVIKAEVNGSGVVSGAGRANDVPNIQQGYTWVGDSNGVAQAVSTASWDSHADLTSLNAFTSSQLTINSGYNSFTSSQTSHNTSVNSFTSSYYTDSSSFDSRIDNSIGGINQIGVNGNQFVAQKNDGTTNVITITTASLAGYATTGSNTFDGIQTVNNGYVSQNVTAPGTNQQKNFIALSSASIDGQSYNLVNWTIQDYPGFGDDYKDTFILEYWNSDLYNFGSELGINGITAKIETTASGSNFANRATLRTQDDGDTTTSAYVEGNTINIGTRPSANEINLGSGGANNLNINSNTTVIGSISSSQWISASAFIGPVAELDKYGPLSSSAGNEWEGTQTFHNSNGIIIENSIGTGVVQIYPGPDFLTTFDPARITGISTYELNNISGSWGKFGVLTGQPGVSLIADSTSSVDNGNTLNFYHRQSGGSYIYVLRSDSDDGLKDIRSTGTTIYDLNSFTSTNTYLRVMGYVSASSFIGDGTQIDGVAKLNSQQTFTADQNVTGRVKQTLDAPADFNQEDFIIINSASVVGNSYPITQFTIQDYTSWAGTDYEDAFVYEYWSAGYGFGSELSINGIHTKLETSPSGSGFTQRATLRTQDNQDGTSAAEIQGNDINIGTASRTNNLTLGRSGITTTINEALKLTSSDPLPSGGVGMLAVSASNLYFHNGTSWGQIN